MFLPIKVEFSIRVEDSIKARLTQNDF